MVDEEDVTAQLLRLAGAPPEPGAERRARVRQAVHEAWRAQRHRRLVRRAMIAALCGVAATVMLLVYLGRARPDKVPAAGSVVATMARIEGEPLIVRGDAAGPQPLTMDRAINAGDVIDTGSTSRASLVMGDGSSLRIDRVSRVRLIAAAALELLDGVAYIETSPGSTGFEVRTPVGSVRDIGTQFEVRVASGAVRIRVRTGKVELQRGSAVTSATAGTETVVSEGAVTVHELAPYGPEWAWTTVVAPAFAIEGRPLSAFLEHIATEQGWTLRYADKDAAGAAGRAVLHGTVDGLTVEEALGVAVRTSGLRYQLHDGQLLVSRPTDSR